MDGIRCPVCGNRLHWDSDADSEDVGYETKGIITYYHCENCGSEVEILLPTGFERTNLKEEKQ